MNDPLARTAYVPEPTPRRWMLRVCDCGHVGNADDPCAGFPGAWDEERGDFDRGSCLGETVEVVEVRP